MCFSVWFKVKLHVKDTKTILDKKRYVAFWLERYVKREPGMPLTVVFDMSESGISNIVSKTTRTLRVAALTSLRLCSPTLGSRQDRRPSHGINLLIRKRV